MTKKIFHVIFFDVKNSIFLQNCYQLLTFFYPHCATVPGLASNVTLAIFKRYRDCVRTKFEKLNKKRSTNIL
jgi:hypothetical protein